MQAACQWTLLLFQILALLINFHTDIEGRPAREPKGFGGVIGTLTALTGSTLLLYGAGAFSLIIGN